MITSTVMSCYLSHIWFFCSLCIINYVCCVKIILETPPSNPSHTYSGVVYNNTIYHSDTFNATYCVDSSNVTLLNTTVNNVVINVLLPYHYQDNSVCYKWPNGTTSTFCQRNYVFYFIFGNPLVTDFTLSLLNETLTPSNFTFSVISYTATDPSYVQFTVPIRRPILPHSCFINIQYNARQFSQSVKRAHIGTPQTFSGKYIFYKESIANNISESNFAPNSLYILGPVLFCGFNTNIYQFQAGDVMILSITGQRSSMSTSNLQNVEIYITFDQTQYQVNGFPLNFTKNHNGNFSLPLVPNLTSSGFTFGTINMTMLDSLKIGTPIVISYVATFEGPPGVTKYMSARSYAVAAANNPTFAVTFDPNPLNITYGDTRILNNAITMPKGTLELTIVGEFSSSTVSPIPGRLKQMTRIGSGFPTVNPSSLSEANMILGTNSRVSRAVTSYATSSTPTITLVNPAASTSPITVSLNSLFGLAAPGTASFSGSGPMNVVFVVRYGSTTTLLATTTLSVVQPILMLNNSVERRKSSDSMTVAEFIFTTEVKHDPASTATAYDLDISLDILGMKVLTTPIVSFFYPSAPNVNQTATVGSSDVSYTSTIPFPIGSRAIMTTVVKVSDNSVFSPGSNIYKRATIVYYSANSSVAASSKQQYRLTCFGCPDCLKRRVITNESAGAITAGIVVLLFFIALIIGAVIAFLILFFWFFCLRRGKTEPDSQKLVSHDDDKKVLQSVENKLIINRKKGDKEMTIDDFHPIKWNDSILVPLSNDDKIQVNRDIDTMDVHNARYIDRCLSDEYDQYRIDGIDLLLDSMVHSDAMSQTKAKNLKDTFNKEVQAALNVAKKQESVETDTALDQVIKKNNDQMALLLINNRKAREELELDLKRRDVSDEYKDAMLKIFDEQVEIEQNDKIHQLRLEQEEEMETIRKKYSYIKQDIIVQNAHKLKDQVGGGTDSSTDAAVLWFLKEHERIQSRITQLHQREMSKQKLLLEDKLQRRRLLALSRDLKEEQDIETLNILAAQKINMIKKLHKNDELSPEAMNHFLAEIKEKLAKSKEGYDKERKKQRDALKETLSKRKADKLKKLDEEKSIETEKTRTILLHQSLQSEDFIDPLSAIETIATAKSKHRVERDQLEADLDQADVNSLNEVLSDVVDDYVKIISSQKEELVDDLRRADVDNDEIAKILRLHKKQFDKLKSEQQDDKEEQERIVKEKMQARRKALEEKLRDDEREQNDLKTREIEIVQDLLDQQLSMSDEERERILREHERNLLQLENNLTSSRIRQKRLLEEAYSRRKAESIRQLELKQNAAKARQERRLGKLRRGGSSSSDEDAEDRRVTDKLAADMKAAEQRLQVARGEEISLEEEMEEVQMRMLEDRAESLRFQEERLAAVITQLQLDKAKELAKIEEQRNAISQLKMTLLDDLSDRNVLSQKKCRQVLEQHEEQMEQLMQKQEREREKHMSKLRKQLQSRAEKKQEQMMRDQDAQREDALSTFSKKDRIVLKLREAILKQKQMIEMDKFKHRMEKQINQNLQDSRQKHMSKIQKILQEEELQFIGGLAKLGKFKRNQLLELLCVIFPHRDRKEIEAILNQILPEDAQNRDDVFSDEESHAATDRLIQKTQILRDAVSEKTASVSLLAIHRLRNPRKFDRRRKGELQEIPVGKGASLTPIDGADQRAGYDFDRLPAVSVSKTSELPPISNGHARKKKKKSKRPDTVFEVDDNVSV